jgi:hypothetical protein
LDWTIGPTRRNDKCTTTSRMRWIDAVEIIIIHVRIYICCFDDPIRKPFDQNGEGRY